MLCNICQIVKASQSRAYATERSILQWAQAARPGDKCSSGLAKRDHAHWHILLFCEWDKILCNLAGPQLLECQGVKLMQHLQQKTRIAQRTLPSRYSVPLRLSCQISQGSRNRCCTAQLHDICIRLACCASHRMHQKDANQSKAYHIMHLCFTGGWTLRDSRQCYPHPC